MVACAAIAGTIRFDIEKDMLGWRARKFASKDIWPSDEEIDAVVKASVKPSQFRQVYPHVHPGRGSGSQVTPPSTTGVRKAPISVARLTGRGIRRAHPARHAAPALLPDNITTDHLSPFQRHPARQRGGEYLAKMGLPEEDFNSYATHRGDHLTAQRATFANPQLVNEMAVVNGVVQKGSLARVEPDGRVMRDVGKPSNLHGAQAAADHRRRHTDYGQGSSRTGRQGVRLAGVEVIAAEGFERIHRTNLIGMGCCRSSSNQAPPPHVGPRWHRDL